MQSPQTRQNTIVPDTTNLCIHSQGHELQRDFWGNLPAVPEGFWSTCRTNICNLYILGKKKIIIIITSYWGCFTKFSPDFSLVPNGAWVIRHVCQLCLSLNGKFSLLKFLFITLVPRELRSKFFQTILYSTLRLAASSWLLFLLNYCPKFDSFSLSGYY